MTNGIFLSTTALNALSPDVRAEVLQVVLGGPEPANSDATEEGLPDATVMDEHFAELSPGQARDFINGCREKTRTAVEVIAKGDTRFFQVAAVAQAIGVSASELRGVWGGLTRRTRTVTKDSEAYIIFWSGEPMFDADGQYYDQEGQIQEMTYQSLKRALNG